jgi:hypothetical protein
MFISPYEMFFLRSGWLKFPVGPRHNTEGPLSCLAFYRMIKNSILDLSPEGSMSCLWCVKMGLNKDKDKRDKWADYS